MNRYKKGRFYAQKLSDFGFIDKIQTEKASFLFNLQQAKHQQANPIEAFLMLWNWFVSLCLKALPYYLWCLSSVLIISHFSLWLILLTAPAQLIAFYLLIKRKNTNLPF